jgi:hypothetical protein
MRVRCDLQLSAADSKAKKAAEEKVKAAEDRSRRYAERLDALQKAKGPPKVEVGCLEEVIVKMENDTDGSWGEVMFVVSLGFRVCGEPPVATCLLTVSPVAAGPAFAMGCGVRFCRGHPRCKYSCVAHAITQGHCGIGMFKGRCPIGGRAWVARGPLDCLWTA